MVQKPKQLRPIVLTLKIHSGWCRGLSLKSPKGLHTRPTSSRTREAIWNSLLGRIEQADIADVFCGSGAVGIEGLSRGAASCWFVEQNRAALQALEANLRVLWQRATQADRSVNWTVCQGDAVKALARAAAERFDIVWLDPPYAQIGTLVERIWPEVDRCLRPEGVGILESDEQGAKALTSYLAGTDNSALLQKQKRYGKTWVSFVSKSERAL
jgi:16S rRNA (guanine(966)-N(2))-methyltransferase RsmD